VNQSKNNAYEQWTVNVCGPRAEESPEWPLYRVTDQLDVKDMNPSKPVGLRSGKWYPGYTAINRKYAWGKGVGLGNKAFQQFRFFVYDDAVFNTTAMFRCFSERRKMHKYSTHPDSWFKDIDRKLSIVQREYLAEVTLIHALLNHPLRTLDPDEADLFFIPFSAALVLYSIPCSEYMHPLLLNNRGFHEVNSLVASHLNSSEYFRRRGGRDHLHISSYVWLGLQSDILSILDSGPMVLTMERYLFMLASRLPNAYGNNRVVILPYVSSTYTDSGPHGKTQEASKDASRWWFFRGTLHRTGVGLSRIKLKELQGHLGGTDFQDRVVNGKSKSRTNDDLLQKTAQEMRTAMICLCPAGDSPTSLRLFESLATGCVPVVMSDRLHMAHVLPFPNLINWDEIAFFTESLSDISSCASGILELSSVLNRTMGPEAEGDEMSRLREIRRKGQLMFHEYFSYFWNPRGVADGVLFETFELMRHLNILAE